MFKLDLEKAEEPEIKLPTSFESLKKQENSRKISISALLTMPKPLTMWMTTNCRKFFKRWEYQTTWPASWEICMQVKKWQLALYIEQWTGSKLAKEYVKAVYCHPAYLTYMQRISCEMLGWMKHKLESVCWEKCQWAQMSRWHHPYGRKWRELKSLFDESEGGEWKIWLQTEHSKS